MGPWIVAWAKPWGGGTPPIEAKGKPGRGIHQSPPGVHPTPPPIHEPSGGGSGVVRGLIRGLFRLVRGLFGACSGLSYAVCFASTVDVPETPLAFRVPGCITDHAIGILIFLFSYTPVLLCGTNGMTCQLMAAADIFEFSEFRSQLSIQCFFHFKIRIRSLKSMTIDNFKFDLDEFMSVEVPAASGDQIF